MKKHILVLSLFMTMICFNACSQSLSGRYVADDEDCLYQYFEFSGRTTVRIGVDAMGFKTRVSATYKIEDGIVIITSSEGTIELEIEDSNTLIGIGYYLDDVMFIKEGTVSRQSSTGNARSTNQKDEAIVVWSFTDELNNLIFNYYLKDNPNVKVNYSMTPAEQFPSKLDPVLASGRGAPDVFALETAFVRKYVESGLLLDITDIYEKNKNKLLAYPVEIGTYNGRVYAMSWQAYPSAMFYRRSIAKKYLGTDDPAVVQTYFSNFNKFMETAELLKQKSGGTARVVSSRNDLYIVFLSARNQPWVVNNRLVIDPVMEQYMDMSRTIYNNRYDGRVGQWSEGWFDGMNGEFRDENRNLLEVFGYFLPTWGLHYVLKRNALDTFGDWAMIPGPASYRWGGTWIGAWKDTKNTAQVKQMIEWLTTNDSLLEQYAKDSGDIVSNINVMNKIAPTFSEPFLGGQNHYAMFVDIAKKVNGKLEQGTDQVINDIFDKEVAAYAEGRKTKEQALADFRAQARIQLGIQ